MLLALGITEPYFSSAQFERGPRILIYDPTPLCIAPKSSTKNTGWLIRMKSWVCFSSSSSFGPSTSTENPALAILRSMDTVDPLIGTQLQTRALQLVGYAFGDFRKLGLPANSNYLRKWM